MGLIPKASYQPNALVPHRHPRTAAKKKPRNIQQKKPSTLTTIGAVDCQNTRSASRQTPDAVA